MKVLFVAIASPGLHYECFKAVWLLHWQNISRWFPDAGLWFIHGNHEGAFAAGPHDRLYPVEECLIPGALHKTMHAFKDFLDSDYECLIRTNLSTFFVWDRLRCFLDRWSGAADVAGLLTDDGSHFTGCNLVLGRKAVRLLYENRDALDYTDHEDVAMSKFILLRSDIKYASTPRYEITDDHLGNEVRVMRGGPVQNMFHVRIKSRDRMLDVQNMYTLARDFKKQHGV